MSAVERIPRATTKGLTFAVGSFYNSQLVTFRTIVFYILLNQSLYPVFA